VFDLRAFSRRLANWAQPRRLLWLGAAAVLGVHGGDQLGARWAPWLLGAFSLWAICLMLHPSRWFLSYCFFIALGFACLQQCALLQSRHHPLYQDLLKRSGGDAVLEGRVECPLRRDMPGATPGSALFYAERVTAPQLGKTYTETSRIRLLLSHGAFLAPGEYQVRGVLSLPNVPDNPGQIDLRERDMRKGLAAQCRVKTFRLIQADRWNLALALSQAADRCRDWVKAQVSMGLEDSPGEAQLIEAALLGGSEARADEIEKPFRQTGTVHIFAVAGLHVGMVGLILSILLGLARIPRQQKIILLIPALFAYAYITGLRPSTFRAAVMTSVFLSGACFHRRSDILNSLGAAALFLLACDTQSYFSTGFRLSFCVLTAIGIFEPAFRRPWKPWVDPDPFLPRVLLSPWEMALWHAKRHLVGLFSISAAATCGALPIMLPEFRLVTPSSIVANMVLVPLAFCILFTASMSLLSALVGLKGAQFLFCNANWGWAKAAYICAQGFAHLPGAYFYLSPPRPAARAPVELTVLRLPTGGAAQHLHVGSQDWLLDCGGARDYPFLLRPYLQHEGVNRLDGLILSHSNSQHVGGAPLLLKDYPVTAIYQSALEPWKGESSRYGLKFLNAQGVKGDPLALGDHLALGTSGKLSVEAQVLYPARDMKPRLAEDRTLVIQLRIGSQRVLWSNDAGFVAEKAMLERFTPEELRSDILLREQHGTDLSATEEFLDAVRPRWIISSNSSFPAHKQLPPELRALCAKRGIQLYDQAETGAVRLDLWPGKLEIHGMREPRRETPPQQADADDDSN